MEVSPIVDERGQLSLNDPAGTRITTSTLLALP
jgi:hypothetical protein